MRTEAATRKRIDMLDAFLESARDRFETVATWLESPYLRDEDREAAFQANTLYLESLLDQIKTLEGGIFELKLVLGEDERVAEEREVWAATRKKNVDSLLKIPAGLIDDTKRAELIARAERDQDVRAYPSPRGGVWNVWDGSQRIELWERTTGKLEAQIEILLYLYRAGGIPLQEFEARILSVLQSAHVAPSPTSPPAENVVDADA